MKLLEGKWDCSNCNHTGILGRHRKCPTCGDPRNPVLTPEEKPYLPSDANEVTDHSLIENFSHGPDWNCGYCGNANLGDASHCENCGRSKDYDDTVNRRSTYLDGVLAQGVTLDPEPDTASERVEEDLDAATRLIEEPDQPRSLNDVILPADALKHSGVIADRVESYSSDNEAPNKRGTALDFIKRNHYVFIGAAVLSVIALIISGLYFLLRTTPQQLSVTEKSWSRSTEVEEFRTLTQEDWSYPSDARVLDSFSAIHHHDRVLDHYDTEYYTDYEQQYAGQESYSYPCGSRTVDYGNGSFGSETQYCNGSRAVYRTVAVQKSRQVPVYRNVPVYRTKYRFEIDRWVFDYWVTVSANAVDDPTPDWPKPNSLETDQRVGSDRQASYTVELKHQETGKLYTQEVDLNTWQSINVGEQVTGNITRGGTLRSVDWENDEVDSK